ncbi:MAG TPA: hypothetical protein VMD77_09465 [Candidatus Baltobacteraceae bacterium]|nr:hypothetical protein [Candidatus Baltobacteraceae bacterium]
MEAHDNRVNSHKALLFGLLLLVVLAAAPGVRGDSSNFDLVGPRIEMTVTRGGKTLPISSVPNLQAGDRMWIHPDFPDDQSVHYLMIVAFLQGPTNPPPETWFTRLDTWTQRARDEGIVVTIPTGAQQALLFLAPETGGDFGTLRSAVRGRPGVFVRASRDLNQASLDRTRIDKYLDEIKDASGSDPATLHQRTTLLAQTLQVKVNQDCFDKPADEQPSCLMQNPDQMLLDDGHGQSAVAALVSGPSSDLIGAISSTPAMGGGYYSAYVGAVVDMARLFGSLHTAEYQYIPALTVPQKEQVDLRLNSPPSFHNPKSVLVVGLPPVEATQLPTIRPVDAKQIFCLRKSPLVLPVEGAPLAFTTSIGRDFALRLKSKSGSPIDLPATPDASRGGFVIDTHALKPDEINPAITGTLHGDWGFDAYDGPTFQLRDSHAGQWKIPPADSGALVVGREDTLHLESDCASCVEKVSADNAQGKDLKATWKILKPDELELQIPLKDEKDGPIKLAVTQFGMTQPDALTLRAYSESARLDHFTLNMGDREGVLTGKRLDEVDGFELSGIHFVPVTLSHVSQEDTLSLEAPSTAAMTVLQADEKVTAQVALKDGRVLQLQTTVEPPRPKVTLVSKSVQPGPVPSGIHLGNQDELPQDGRLSFFLKTVVPDNFPPTEKIEVATTDGSFDVVLSVTTGNLILQDSKSALAILDPQKNFGPSAFGPVQFRPIDAAGVKGDWQPLVNLVRIPSLQEVRCPDDPGKQCMLSGSNLFLLDSVASDAQFKNVVPVPLGYVDSTLSVPRPIGTLLYLKLRDDPATVDTVALPVLPAE